MLQPIKLPDEIEPLVRLVEDTAPEEIVESVLQRLRTGTSVRDMLTASALAVSRSCELPADHHGGPVHPVSGVHGVLRLSQRLEGDDQNVPVVQNVALANKHIHDVETGPTSMLDIASLMTPDDGSATIEEAFVSALQRRKPLAAERYLLAALSRLSPDQVLDCILTVAIPRAALDEHHFNYVVFTARTLDEIGWQWAPVLLRPPVRYVASHPALYGAFGFPDDYVDEILRNWRDFSSIEGLIDEFRLLQIDLRQTTGADETTSVGELARCIGLPENVARIPRLLAEALASGLSLEGAGEALSVGAAELFLRCRHASPDEVHMHTAINARRYLLKRENLGLRTKLLALLSWNRDPEVHFANTSIRCVPEHMCFSPGADEATLAGLPKLDQDELLDAIEESIRSHPEIPASQARKGIQDLVAWPKIQHTLALAEQYAVLGYDPAAFFARVGVLACEDEVSEMHGYKFQQAVYEEYHTTRPDYRWFHLVSVVKHVACIFGIRPKPIYEKVVATRAA